MSTDIDAWERRGVRRQVRGDSIFVIDEPAQDPGGVPVLVLHGFPTCSYDWEPVLAALSAAHRVVVPDLLGYGFSAKPDRGYSLFDQADLVEELAAALRLDEVALVTHDMGDSVGGEIVARDLDGRLSFRIARRVVTNGSIYLDLAQLTDGQKLLLSLPDEKLPADAAPNAEALAAALRATLAQNSLVADDVLAAHAALLTRDGGNCLLPRLIRYIEERRVHEGRWTGAIERHPAPLTVVWGDADPIAVWPMAERLQGARADATVVRLRGVGHYPMLETPERFADAVVGALS
ncbi:MAG: alpha/beta fold hydrolase [Acidimicrobiia bacterium]